VTNNVFLCSDMSAQFSFIIVKPYGQNHRVNGMNVSGNLFRSSGGTINRVDRVDTSFAGLNLAAMRNIHFTNNTYLNVSNGVENPLLLSHAQNTHAQTWVIDTANRLPFGGYTLQVESLVLSSRPRDTSNVSLFATPYTSVREGGGQDQVHAIWPEPVRGDATLRVRMDS